MEHIHLDAKSGYHEKLLLSNAIPPVETPADSVWVKRVKLESKLLSQFWGRPIYIGATVLLPKGYDEHPDTFYPAIYLQGHFSLDAPFDFKTEENKNEKSWARERQEHAAKHLNFLEPPPYATASGSLLNVETGYEFYQAWNSNDFPRVIAVILQHPTPYYDDSYAVNSANHGPAGDAIMNELIPYVEKSFRIIRKPYARVLTGGSTRGWESLALQVYHPDLTSSGERGPFIPTRWISAATAISTCTRRITPIPGPQVANGYSEAVSGCRRPSATLLATSMVNLVSPFGSSINC